MNNLFELCPDAKRIVKQHLNQCLTTMFRTQAEMGAVAQTLPTLRTVFNPTTLEEDEHLDTMPRYSTRATCYSIDLVLFR